MDCTYFRTLGSAIIDNEATDSEIKEFNEHIKTCKDCAKWFETIKILKDETEDLGLDAPDELKTRVMRSISMADKKPSFFSRFRFTAVAAVIAVIIIASNAIPRQSATEPATNAPQSITPPSATLSATPAQNDGIAPASEVATPQSRMAPAPAADSAPALEKLPYDKEFSYVIYVADSAVSEVLSPSKCDVIDGYCYYVTELPIESFDNFSPQDLPFSSPTGSMGLVITKAN